MKAGYVKLDTEMVVKNILSLVQDGIGQLNGLSKASNLRPTVFALDDHSVWSCFTWTC